MSSFASSHQDQPKKLQHLYEGSIHLAKEYEKRAQEFCMTTAPIAPAPTRLLCMRSYQQPDFLVCEPTTHHRTLEQCQTPYDHACKLRTYVPLFLLIILALAVYNAKQCRLNPVTLCFPLNDSPPIRKLHLLGINAR